MRRSPPPDSRRRTPRRRRRQKGEREGSLFFDWHGWFDPSKRHLSPPQLVFPRCRGGIRRVPREILRRLGLAGSISPRWAWSRARSWVNSRSSSSAAASEGTMGQGEKLPVPFLKSTLLRRPGKRENKQIHAETRTMAATLLPSLQCDGILAGEYRSVFIDAPGGTCLALQFQKSLDPSVYLTVRSHGAGTKGFR
jgi:hypothetical protein